MGYRRFFALPLILLLFLSPSLAQEVVDEVVITASYVPIRAIESGSALSVIDGDALELHQITMVFDALRDVPGVAVSRTGAPGSLSQIRMRGGESNHTLVLIDGVEANDPAASSEFNFAHLMSAGVERIEVLRGPQSALWGADAVAGVVNVLTAAPVPGNYARGGVEVGSFGTRQVSALFNAGIEGRAIVLDAAHLNTSGSNISRTGNEKDGYENLTLGARGVLRIESALTLHAAFRRIQGISEFDAGFPYPLDTDDSTRAVQDYGRVEARTNFSGGALQAVAGAALTGTWSDNYSSGELTDGIKGGKSKFDFLASVYWNGEGLGRPVRQRLSVLAETARDTFSQQFVTLPIADQKQSLRESGVAAEYWAAIGDDVYLSLGARQDWNSRFADAATWRATISIPLAQMNARVHAGAGTGVKNPDFYELFGFVPSGFIGNPALLPETSFGYDAGVEARLFSGLAVIDATYYRADLENEIFTDFSVYPSTARNAVGKSLREGVEFALDARLGGGWALTGAYSFTRSTASGVAELRRPRHVGSLGLDYIFAAGAAHVGAGVDYHGEQRDTDFGSFQDVTLPGYVLARISGSYRVTDRLEVTARIENALDRHYEEVIGYRARGFGAFTGLRVRFGE